MNWDNHKQTKIAYIDRREGNVCGTMKFGVDSEFEAFERLNQIAYKFGFSDKSFLVIVADFPSSMLGFQANQFIAERGGHYFLAACHPVAKARSYYERLISHGSIVYV